MISLCKELSLCHKLYKFETQCRKPLIFQSMNYVGGNNLILKYQRFTSSGCKNLGIRKFEFVTLDLISLANNVYREPLSAVIYSCREEM